MPKVSVSIVAGEKEQTPEILGALLGDLENQSFRDFEILVWDNFPGEEVTPFLREKKNLISGKSTRGNLGWCAATNRNLALSSAPFFLTLNPRQTIPPDFLEKMLAGFKKKEDVGLAIPLTMIWEGEPRPWEFNKRSREVDLAGHRLHEDFRMTHIGNHLPLEKFLREFGEEPAEVVAGSGSGLFFRRAALDAIQLGEEEWLDEDFWMYREEVDLGLRLWLGGWRVLSIPAARHWYRRSSWDVAGTGWLAEVKHRLIAAPRHLLLSSLTYDFFLEKFFFPNRRWLPWRVCLKTRLASFLRSCWEFLLERKVFRERRRRSIARFVPDILPERRERLIPPGHPRRFVFNARQAEVFLRLMREPWRREGKV